MGSGRFRWHGPPSSMPQTLAPSLNPRFGPGFTSPGSVLNPHMLFGHPVRDGRDHQKEAGGEGEEEAGKEVTEEWRGGDRDYGSHTHNPPPNPVHAGHLALPAQPPQPSGQALTRIWFRSCSASCLSCSSSLMAPGPWGGVGGGWGPRDGGWGRQLLAAGPRPGGCRADVRPKAAGEEGGKGGVETRPGRGKRRSEVGGRESSSARGPPGGIGVSGTGGMLPRKS